MASLEIPGQKTLQKVTRLLVAPTVEPSQRAARIQTVEKDIVLPIKGLLIIILACYFFFSDWEDARGSVRQQAFDGIRAFFLFYVVVNAIVATIFIRVRQLSLRSIEWIVFGMGLLDCVLMAALTFRTNGFDSVLYWVFPALILHNALAIPVATPQIALNVLVSCCYIFGGVADKKVALADATADEFASLVAGTGGPVVRRQGTSRRELSNPTNASPALVSSTNRTGLHTLPLSKADEIKLMAAARIKAPDIYAESHPQPENPYERLIVLLLWTACCYGIQVLFEKQKRAEAEATEFAVRQERLHTAGRMAAEIAHEIKNPLGIITNAAFSLQRAVKDGKTAVDEQIQIIREEVDRADLIITELMGYAQLAEGKVEKLDVAEALDEAIQQVFPHAAKYEVEVRKDYAPMLPTLLMQRRHFSGVLVNILQNAREAMHGHGTIEILARYNENNAVIVIISDNGPGIAPDKLDKIFEAYFTTRAKGTGLGLAIVKHNTEIYGGTVRVESELGKGTRFILEFPPRILMKLTS